jgi:acyl-CoA synthetase (AMP-forming)/AMP-acid ligase II
MRRERILRSPYADVEIPDVGLTAFVLEHAAGYGDRPALIDGPSGRTLSYVELDAAVRRCAVGFAARGLRVGEVVVAVQSERARVRDRLPRRLTRRRGVHEHQPPYTHDELAFQLKHAGARFLVTVPELAELALAAAREASVEEVYVFGEAEGATPFAALLAADGQPPPVPIVPAEHVVALPYSSGTTGLPKGVMLTHRNLVAFILQYLGPRPTYESDVIVAFLPFFHIYGLMVLLNVALRSGATVVTMPRFDFEQYLSLSEKHQATVAYLAPPVALMLAKDPRLENYDLSSLRTAFCAAAPLDADLARACAARLGCELSQGYGMTEASPGVSITPVGDASSPGSVGPLLPCTEARIVDVGTGRDVGPVGRGELLVRGPQVMKGYLNDDAATATTIEDGWLRTGDVVTADHRGWLTIVDRIKELIKVSAYQVAPAELEAILLTHPAVADACVIGVPDERTGEAPKAFVVVAGEIDDEDILSYVAERVAPHKRIRHLERLDTIPKSPSGKILRRMLIERERERDISRPAPSLSPRT